MFELATRRPRGVVVTILISTCAALVLLGQPLWQPARADAAPSEQAKPISHPLEGRENCTACHQLGAGVKAMPADHAGRTSDSCLMCHKQSQAASPAQPATSTPSRPATAPTASAALPADTPTPSSQTASTTGGPKPIPHSIQGRENCLTCHTPGAGLKPSPVDHAGRGSDTCVICHKAAEGRNSGGAAEAAEPVKARPTPDPVKASVGCRGCHNQPEFQIVSNISSQPDTVKQLEPDREYAHRMIACVTCHSDDPHQDMAPITKESIAEACGKCHVQERQEHESSVHGQSLAAGGKDAATCIDCHSTQNNPHSIARVLSPDSPAYRASVASTCAKCHAKNEVMAKYDVPTEVYKTYMATFHGKANVLSPYEITQHPKATCINCHGYHDIKAESDPTSPVNKANLPATCGGCHPGAGEQFAAGWLGHKEATPQQFPVVYFAERFFFFLTSSVLTFGFIFMVALQLGSWILRRKSSDREE